MGKLIKLLLGLVLLLVVLIVAAAIVIPMLVNPNDFKPEIVNQVKQTTGRDLRIDGDIQLSVFPWLGVELGAVSLDQPEGYGDRPFAAIEKAQLKAKFMPLLKRQLEVDTIELQGLQLNLIRNDQGVGNWEDLARGAETAATDDPPPQVPEKPRQDGGAALESFAIGGVKISNALIVWDDRQAGKKIALRDVGLQTGALAPGEAADIKLGFKLENDTPQLSLTLGLSGTLDASDDFQLIQVRGFELRAEDLKMQDGLSANALLKAEIRFDAAANRLQLNDFSVQKQITGGPLQGRQLDTRLLATVAADLGAQIVALTGIQLDAKITGKDIPGGQLQAELSADVNANLGQDSLAVNDLKLQAAGLRLSVWLKGTGVSSAPVYTGNLNLAEFNLRELMQAMGMEPPITSDPKVLQRFALSADIKSTAKQAALNNLNIVLDDSKLSGEASLRLGKVLGYRFNLELDSINADRYLPPPPDKPAPDGKPQSAQAPAADANAPLLTQQQLEQLRGLDVEGRFSIGQLIINKLKLGQAVINLRAQNGDIKLKQQVGAFYQGRLGGDLGLDVRGKAPVIKVVQRVQQVQAENLVKDLTGKDRLSGAGNFNLNLAASGANLPTIKRSLNGKLDFAFTQGAVKGINIGRVLREAAAKLKGQTLPPEKGVQKTDFSELSGSGVINNGVLDNQDLSAKSPLFRVTGKGTVNIGEGSLDYRLTPVLVASLEGQGGADLDRLKGVPIPIQLTGPLNAPNWRIDLAAALAESQKAKLKEKASEKLQKVIPKDIQEKLPGGLDKQLDGALKGLFN